MKRMIIRGSINDTDFGDYYEDEDTLSVDGFYDMFVLL